jgi:hypothetical protein
MKWCSQSQSTTPQPSFKSREERVSKLPPQPSAKHGAVQFGRADFAIVVADEDFAMFPIDAGAECRVNLMDGAEFAVVDFAGDNPRLAWKRVKFECGVPVVFFLATGGEPIHAATPVGGETFALDEWKQDVDVTDVQLVRIPASSFLVKETPLAVKIPTASIF